MRDLTLPTLAESVVEGEILSWLVEEGDLIEEGQPVLEVMTDKVTVELPAPFGGRIVKRMVQVGDIVPVHGVLAQVEDAAGEQAPAPLRPSNPVTRSAHG